jgi:hypothetical protein
MPFNKELLEKLMEFNEKKSLDFTLYVNDMVYPISSTSIIHSPIPVNEPTTRGGVYFSDKFAYKIKCVVRDLSVIPLLTKKMLGPNTEFGELKITTMLDSVPVEIFTNLTNSVQTPDSIELSMIIVKLDSA